MDLGETAQQRNDDQMHDEKQEDDVEQEEDGTRDRIRWRQVVKVEVAE